MLSATITLTNSANFICIFCHYRERYPSGDYPMQRDTEDGLIKWTAQNRNIENTDLVVWYTVGITHVCIAIVFDEMKSYWC